MKHLTFKFAVLSLAVTAMVGCSKEQSSLNIEDIPGKAKVMGTFTYDAGQSYTNGVYAQQIKGAASVRVKAQISNSSIKSNSTGYTTYETTTDESGNYSIEIPAVPNGTNVEIIADPFFATYSEVTGVNNNTPEIKSEEVLFKVQSTNVSIRPDDIKIYDAIYSYTERDVNEADKYTAKFIVKVGQGYHSKKKDEYQEDVVERGYKTVSGKDVLVKDNSNGKYYGATTNSNGEATFIIPTANKAWQKSISIEVPGYVENKYKFYKREWDQSEYEYKVNSYTLEGVFKLYGDDTRRTISYDGIEGVPTPVCKVRMIFQPFEGEEDHDYYWDYLSWTDDSND